MERWVGPATIIDPPPNRRQQIAEPEAANSKPVLQRCSSGAEGGAEASA